VRKAALASIVGPSTPIRWPFPSPPEYDREMRDRYSHYRGGRSDFWNAIAGSLLIACPVIMITEIFTDKPLIRAAFGILASAGSMLYAVRWVNRRDDPDHAKRPPDDP